jgi:hypothetical protein
VGPWADIVETPVGNADYNGELNPTGGKKYELSRGWVTRVNVGQLVVRKARALIAAPQLRLVRELFVGDVYYATDGEYYETDDDDVDYSQLGGFEDHPGQQALVPWPQLRYIRHFHWGWPVTEGYEAAPRFSCLISGGRVLQCVEQMRDIEELLLFAHVSPDDIERLVALPMPNLRTFQHYHGWEYHLDKLAANPTLGRLERLLCHPRSARLTQHEAFIRLEHLWAVCRSPHLKALTHLRLRLTDFGDLGASEIVNSGIMRRLKILDLRHGCMTDEGPPSSPTARI